MNEKTVGKEEPSSQRRGASSGDRSSSRGDTRQKAREEIAELRKEAEMRKIEMEDEIARLERAEHTARIELEEAIERLRAEEDGIRERTQDELDRLKAREDSILDSLRDREDRELARRRRTRAIDRDDPLWDMPDTRRRSPILSPTRVHLDQTSNIARAYTQASVDQLRLVTDAIRSLTDSLTGAADPYSGAARRGGPEPARRRYSSELAGPRRSASARRAADDVYGSVVDTLQRAIEIPSVAVDSFYDAYGDA